MIEANDLMEALARPEAFTDEQIFDAFGSGNLGPDEREKRGATGTPAILGDGKEWLLADWMPTVNQAFEDFYHAASEDGYVLAEVIRPCAMVLLQANYLLTAEEAVRLIVGAKLKDLVGPVSRAVFGPDSPRHSFTEWIATSLWANGLDPASIPPRMLRPVLEYLVQQKKAIPEGEYVSSQIRGRRKREMRHMARQAKAAGMAAAQPPTAESSSPGSSPATTASVESPEGPDVAPAPQESREGAPSAEGEPSSA